MRTPSEDHRPACRAPGVDPWIFEATTLEAHTIAKRYCLGDRERPQCPVLEWCHTEMLAARDAANAYTGGPDGTWAGVLYRDGKPKAQQRDTKSAAQHTIEPPHTSRAVAV